MDIPTDPTTTAYWEVVLWDAIADWTLGQMELGKIEAIEPYCGGRRRKYLRHKLTLVTWPPVTFSMALRLGLRGIEPCSHWLTEAWATL